MEHTPKDDLISYGQAIPIEKGDLRSQTATSKIVCVLEDGCHGWVGPCLAADIESGGKGNIKAEGRVVTKDVSRADGILTIMAEMRFRHKVMLVFGQLY